MKKGFTLIELMVAVFLLLTLFGLTTLNLGRIPSSTASSATYDVLIADIKSQQMKAMADNSSYGIHFDITSYTLIPGSFVVNLDPGLTFTDISYPNGDLNFSAHSGDGVDGTVTISNSQTNTTAVIQINKYGATY